MDVDLSTDLAALLPLVAPLRQRSLRPGDRLPADARARGCSAGPSGSSSRAATTCCCAARCGRGSPTRSAASRRSARDVARELLPLVEDDAWFFDTELLVLAERAGPADPRGPGRLGRRPGQQRRHRAHRARRPPRDRPAGRAHCCAGPLPLAEIGERLGRTSADGRARAHRHAGRHLPGRSGSARRWPTRCSTWCCAPTIDAVVGERHRPAAHGGRQHRGQPAVHLRRARPAGRRTPPGAGAGRSSRPGSRVTSGLAVAAARGRPRPSRAAEVVVLTAANLVVTVLRFVAMRLWVFVRASGSGVGLSLRTSAPGSPAATPTGSPAAPRD